MQWVPLYALPIIALIMASVIVLFRNKCSAFNVTWRGAVASSFTLLAFLMIPYDIFLMEHPLPFALGAGICLVYAIMFATVLQCSLEMAKRYSVNCAHQHSPTPTPTSSSPEPEKDKKASSTPQAAPPVTPDAGKDETK